MDLFQLVNNVQDESSFLQFMLALSRDRQDRADEWQNDDIASFAESAARWGAASSEGLPFYEKPDNAWKRCAQILYMGKIYE